MLRTVYIAIFVPAILAVLFVGRFVLKKCLKPVKSIHKAIISMENGDLSYAPDYFGDDILGTLCEALAKTNTALKWRTETSTSGSRQIMSATSPP